MSEHTSHADQSVADAQKVLKDGNYDRIKLSIDHLALAVSSLISAVQQVENDLSELEAASGEDPGIEISHLKDTISDLERRIETLERQGD